MPDEKPLTQGDKKPVKKRKVKINRDNQNLPKFEKVTVRNTKGYTSYNNTRVITNTDDPLKPLPEIELFSHHNFNMFRTVPQADDGVYGGEELISLRTSFDTDLEGHDLYKAVSSIIVYAGHWAIYQGDTLVVILGPGQYKEVSEDGIGNDSITKIKSISI